MKNADMAMYKAKALGKNCYQLFTSELNQEVRRRIECERDIRNALAANGLFAAFQAKIEIATGRVVGLEALARWNRNGTLVPPADFIPVAESSGLIDVLGMQVLRFACSHIRALQPNLGQPLRLAVNLSPIQFRQDDLVERIAAVLEEVDLPPWQLELEITESALAGDFASVADKLRRLVDMGIDIALDDFGTGYSTFAYLKNWPLTSLKMDRSYVQGIATDPKDLALAKTIVQVARNFGLKVIAEGVETEDQSAILREIAVDQVQGFLFCKPLMASELTDYLGAEPGSALRHRRA
jgi:EAL domain-containing protein (putative c-di-GMP-specific phosphodiesterase class I)